MSTYGRYTANAIHLLTTSQIRVATGVFLAMSMVNHSCRCGQLALAVTIIVCAVVIRGVTHTI